MTSQPGILPGIPDLGRYIELRAKPGASLKALEALKIDQGLVVGIGPRLAGNDAVYGFKALSGAVDIPSTQADLLLWLRGNDAGEIATRARHLLQALPEFEPVRVVNGFKFGVDLEIGLDLSGYEDGTENPVDAAANAAAFAPDGSSFLSLQVWEHDLATFEAHPQAAQDDIFGRRRSDNEEMEDAPEFAHVKRTAQESFTPEAFVLRRSMPWSEGGREGLVFAAFGHSLAPFEALLNRMAGFEDGIIDGLFTFTHPVSGANYWCPPVASGKLVLKG
ncbi:MAG: Dyp-type peroxidase [Rhodobacteraceae bacterium]|nr:Dyp-type peroxidase [Paracoccaceae bacterium]